MMKTTYLIILLIMVPVLSYAQCPYSLTLTTQAEIDSFTTDFPDCTGIGLNTLNILGEDIVNLNGLSQLESIEELTVEGTSIQDFTGLENLTEVQGSLLIQNNETLIDFTGMGSLTSFGSAIVFSNESLESFSGIGPITNIEGGFSIVTNNSLTSLEDLSSMSAQVFMGIEDNDILTSLDGLQNISYLSGLNCSRNNILTDISALTYVPINSISQYHVTIRDNPMLSNCSVLSICLLLPLNSFVEIYDNNDNCTNESDVLDNCPDVLNQITGNIRYDVLADGCDISDVEVASVLVEITNGDHVISTHTNQDGNYNTFVGGEGTYVTSVVTANIPSYFSISPATIETVFTSIGETAQVDFCIEEVTDANDLKITLLQLEEVRPGFDTNFQMVVENMGTEITNGVVTLGLDTSGVTYLSGIPTEDNVSGNQVLWTISDIAPFSSQIINFTVNSLPPPVNESGDLIDFTTTITPVESDETPEDNTSSIKAIYVNSQDPNDKMVQEGAEILENQVGDFLNYIVRFQNIGSADAINVRVDDLLDVHLDVASFRVLSASHEYQLEITGNNNVSFIFDDINLPSIDVDEEGSNGFIAYQIRTNNDLEIGDSVYNRANIFFDFNAPIITNTVTTTVVEPLAIDEFDIENVIKVFPNPVFDILSIELLDTIEMSHLIVYSLSGEELLVSRQRTLDFSKYSKGIYFVKVFTRQGNFTKKIIKR